MLKTGGIQVRKILFISLILVSVLIFSLDVSYYISTSDFSELSDSLDNSLRTSLSSVPAFTLKDPKVFRETLVKFFKTDKITDLNRLIFASRLLKLKYLFFLNVQPSDRNLRVTLTLIDAKAAQAKKLFEKHIKSEKEIDIISKAISSSMERFKKKSESAVKVMVKFQEWEKGKVYKKGDIVRFEGKLFKCQRLHVSTDSNSPKSSKYFWKELGKKLIAVYFPSWVIQTKSFSENDIDGDIVTHVFFAFANVSDDGRCIVGDPNLDMQHFKELKKLKEKYPHLKVIISVGGWNWSKNFPKAAATEQSRRKFIKSCIDTFIKGNFGNEKIQDVFDGIDIDWEYPTGGGKYPGTPQDKHNFTLLMKGLREALDDLSKKTSKRYILTFAGAADPDYINRKVELGEVSKYVDYIVLMTYDFHGSWDRIANFHNNLYPLPGDESPWDTDLNVDAAVRGYISHGVPPEKILLGIPFYGRSWSGVAPENDGLLQRASGLGPGTKEAGVLDYSDIVNRFEPLLEKHFHPVAQVPWLYGDGVFITYDDPNSAALKALYVLTHDLAGVAIWEISCDIRGVPAPEGSLLRSIYEVLEGKQ